ncbi:MAG: rRNA maturation RNase YbeY [Alphaproteobacteria bacterium]|nr:rRNA maturation RNase YbeY [Alphaproteobacteria bacterium]
MNVTIDVDDAAWGAVADLEALTRQAVAATLDRLGLSHGEMEASILFTGDAEMAALNRRWRGKDGPTNVLSFPAEEITAPAGEARPIGDIVLAAGTVARESAEQAKRIPDHMAHLVVHGLLHLLGYDHEDDAEADAMEALEIEVLDRLGIGNPYDRH